MRQRWAIKVNLIVEQGDSQKSCKFMKHPEDCHSIDEIRWEIDQLDRDIIKKFSTRFDYVKAAAKFKTSKATVRASERFNSMLQQRRIWAEEEGLNPDVIEQLYRDLVQYFIREELERWEKK